MKVYEMKYVKQLLTSRLAYHEYKLRFASLDDDSDLCQSEAAIVLEIKRALEILYASGEM